MLETEATLEPEREGSRLRLRSPCMDHAEQAAEQWAKAQDSEPLAGEAMDRPAAVVGKRVGRVGPVERKPAAESDSQDVVRCIPPAPTEHSVALELKPLGRVQGTALGSAHDTMGKGPSPRRDFQAPLVWYYMPDKRK